MPRQRRLPPDLRPDWRDPDMPVLLSCRDRVTGKDFLREFTPDRATYAFARKIARCPAPSWRQDPTYEMRKPKP